MEAQRVAQIEHQTHQIRNQEDESDRISHSRHGGEDRRRCQLAERGHQKEAGCQIVEQQIPGDEPVPVGRLGHRAVSVGGVGRIAIPSHG